MSLPSPTTSPFGCKKAHNLSRWDPHSKPHGSIKDLLPPQANGAISSLELELHSFIKPFYLTPYFKILVLFILAMSLMSIAAAAMIARQFGKPMSLALHNLYQDAIKPSDSFVPSSSANELTVLKEAMRYHDSKLYSTIDELQKSRNEAIKASRNKSDFLANMSHEIRTPLNGVLGMAQLIQFTELTAEQRKYVNAIIDAGDSLIGIINDILDFSKIEAGLFQVEYQDFDLRRCLNNTLQIFELKAKEKGLQLILNVMEDTPKWVNGDELRFRQILTNLVSNAIKFTAQGHVRIDLSSQTLEDGKIHLKVAVSDTGIGIDKDDLNKLFKSFTQANNSIARKFGGTGLGLAISQALCSMMGGSIHVESSKGQGTCFSFDVMFKTAQTSPNLLPAAAKAYNKDLRILVAEDSDVNQLIIRTMFKKLGFKIELAANGREAIDKALSEPYDIIYMDVHMPEIEGPAAALRILSETKQSPPPKIIALTADMFKDDHAKCLSSGMVDLVMKPIKLQDLVDSLVKHGGPIAQNHRPTELAS